jgi:hypothetical protein
MAQLGAHAQHPRLFSDIFHRRAGRPRSVYVCAQPMLAYASTCVFTSCFSNRACVLVHDKKRRYGVPGRQRQGKGEGLWQVQVPFRAWRRRRRRRKRGCQTPALGDNSAHVGLARQAGVERAVAQGGGRAHMCVQLSSGDRKKERKRAREFIRSDTP